ncbi:MAG: pntA [Rickettsiales bacterium]|jgi:NAD(P) transhydrogenase subunit alpha|nr:pntA [Rickettsiales bacterium]
MKIAIVKERAAAEARVAVTPDIVKKYSELGATVVIEAGAGESSAVPDNLYKEAGATIAKTLAETLDGADILLMVQPSSEVIAVLPSLKKGAIVVGMLSPLSPNTDFSVYASAGVSAFSMELVPRITRAQSMDVLSSQSNLAGYKAVLDAAAEFGKAIPMMMTAAGTIAPAKVCIMGAGVAGLQAIATAKRLGAVVSAFDVRPAAKEQVESLGAKFVEVDPEAAKNAETSGGYAKEMSEEYKQKQQQVIHNHIQKMDIVITTALIPGRPAPVLVTEETVKAMKPGSVIVDLAVTAGGNCPLSERGKVVTKHGVTIVGHENVPARLAVDASKLYSKNLLNFLTLLIKDKAIVINQEDEIIKASLVVHGGSVVKR